MNKPSVRGYQPAYGPHARQQTDIISIIASIPPLTRVGGLCLIAGKFVGLLAIPAVFIPSLNAIGIILVITWGALVFTAIVLCSYEHFRSRKVENETEKMALIKELIAENPSLREQLSESLKSNDGEPEDEELYARRKVIHLDPRLRR
ncbi:MAG: hypothetical protein GXO34_09050 [Deltaproteobacteria bacterium]|nr:hypothetical protein [Deltaproteobacteria bacterium]